MYCGAEGRRTPVKGMVWGAGQESKTRNPTSVLELREVDVMRKQSVKPQQTEKTSSQRSYKSC